MPIFLKVLSVSDTYSYTLASASHQVHPFSDATYTCPHASVEHSCTTFLSPVYCQSVKSRAITAAVCTLAYTSPSCEYSDAAGGHEGEGEGVIEIFGRGFRFFFFFTTAFFVEVLDAFGEAVADGFFFSVVVFFVVDLLAVGFGFCVAASAELIKTGDEKVKRNATISAIFFMSDPI